MTQQLINNTIFLILCVQTALIFLIFIAHERKIAVMKAKQTKLEGWLRAKEERAIK